MRARLALLTAAAVVLSTAAVPQLAHAEGAPTGSDASSTTTPTGRYYAHTPVRVLDTRSKVGVPTTTPLHGGDIETISLSKYNLPSGTTSVVVNLTVVDPTSSGYLTTYASGTPRPGGSSLNYGPGSIARNLVVVPLGAGTKINLYVGTRGTVHVAADLTGYFRSTSAGLGGFGSAASRVLSTRDGIGVSKAGPLAARSRIDFTAIRGTAGIPDDASAVVLDVSVGAPTASGYATAYPSGGTFPKGASLYFRKGLTTSALAVVPIGNHGKVTLWNGSTGQAQFYADIEGYVAGGDPTTVGALGALASRRLLDTRGGASIGPGKTVTFDTFGRGGVPRSRVAQVALSVTASTPTRGGYLTAYSGSRPSAATLNYDKGHTISNVAIVKPDSAGRIKIYNGSSGRTDVIADVNGYTSSADIAVPTTTMSRYVTDPTVIASSGDTSEGCVDGKSGATFVLLDIGAQTITPDKDAGIDAAHPGVALARTNPTVRLTYTDLVDDLNGYLSEFARCRGSAGAARIALGTNNDGAFSGTNGYPATTRGLDWANQVVDAVAPRPGISIVGANDIEAGFSSSEAQAEQWVTSFLANTPANLVYNGSLDNCPDAYASTAECAPAAGKTEVWTRADYVRLTYGLKPGRITVLPQIYFNNDPDQAAQWTNLYVSSGKRLMFEGALTQYGVCGSVTCGLTGSQGWSNLFHALSTVVATPSLPVSTDLAPN